MILKIAAVVLSAFALGFAVCNTLWAFWNDKWR